VATLVWVLPVELVIFHDHFSWEDKWQITEQLNASETHVPLVVLFLFMLLEIGPCYDSLKGVSRIVCWVAAFLRDGCNFFISVHGQVADVVAGVDSAADGACEGALFLDQCSILASLK